MNARSVPSPPAVEPAGTSAQDLPVKSRLLCGATVFATSLCVYVLSLAPTVTLVDSGELIVAARTLGVAHPPGFPLYVLLAHLATLVPFGSIAVRVNFASALFAALACGLVTLAVLEAMMVRSGAAGGERQKPAGRRSKRTSLRDAKRTNLSRLEPPKLSNAVAPALAAGLLFAFSRTLWAYATIAEVYTLNSMLIAAIVLLMLRWQRLVQNDREEMSGGRAVRGSPHDRWLYAAALVFGLALGVHHVTVGLLLPAFAALVLATEGLTFFASRRLVKAALFAFGGLSVYVYLPVAASRSPVLNWGDPRTLDRFLAHVTGWQYRIFFEAKPERIWNQLGEFLGMAAHEFGPVWLPLSLALAVAGLTYLARRSAGLFWFLLVAVLANLAYNANYEIAEDKDAYYLPVFLSLTIAAAFGARYAIEKLPELAARFPRLEVIAAATLLTVVPAVSLASSFPFDNRRHYFIARDYVENILSTVEPKGMILTLDWQVYSPMFYLREIEGLRRDVVAIDINQLRRSWYFAYLERTYPQTMNQVKDEASAFLEDLRHWEQDPDLYQHDAALNRRISSRFQDLILALVANHLESAPVYVTQDVATYREGRESDWAQQIATNYQLVPEGLIFRLYSDRAFHEPAAPALVTRGLTDGSLRFDQDDVVRAKVLPVYAGMLFKRGRYLAAAGRHEAAIEAFKQAIAIEPRFSAAEQAIADSQTALRRAK